MAANTGRLGKITKDVMMKQFRSALLALTIAAFPAAAQAGSFDDAQKKEIGEIVRAYLLENPQVLIEVSKELEARQQAEEEKKRSSALAEHAKEIFHSEADFVAGNPQGDVTIVEFFDYNCPWCKKSAPIIEKLLKDDKGLKLIFKEFPILGEASEYASRAAIAAKAQGKYLEFHMAVFGHEGKVDAGIVDGVAQSLGLDMAKFKSDVLSPETTQIIERNRGLAQTLGITGTPGFIVDRDVIPGFIAERQMVEAITKMRQSGGCTLC